MRFTRSWTIFAFFAVIPPSAYAREVHLLEFGRAAPSAQILESSLTDHSTTAAVPQTLWDHFNANSGDQVNLPALPVHAWRDEQQSGEHITRSQTHEQLGFLPPSSTQLTRLRRRSALIFGTICEGAKYAPTWWLSRSAEARRAHYFETVARTACEHGIPTRLLDSVIAQESGYNASAISSAGAMGMMQIMPGTARLLGLATPFDPVENLRAGARYLRQQLDRFGRVDLALAAYNAGPERRSLQRGFVPAIPETINYVRAITTNWARLAELGGGEVSAADRALAAVKGVRTSGYRDVELMLYDGLNRANPM